MRRLGIVLLLVIGLAAPAFASPVGTTGVFEQARYPGYYLNTGGEFTVYGFGTSLSNEGYSAAPATMNIPPSIPESFQTFCLEGLESSIATNYFVVSGAAVTGGTVPPTSDPLSMGTAWLYSQFATGLLNVPGGNYFTGDRRVSAGLLQAAFWMLEDELATDPGNPYYAAALLHGGATTAPVGYMGVYALNNFIDQASLDSYMASGTLDGKRQDYLWYHVPDGGATLMLLGGALLGLGAIRRKLGA